MKAGNDNGWPHNIQLKAEMLTKTGFVTAEEYF